MWWRKPVINSVHLPFTLLISFEQNWVFKSRKWPPLHLLPLPTTFLRLTLSAFRSPILVSQTERESEYKDSPHAIHFLSQRCTNPDKKEKEKGRERRLAGGGWGQRSGFGSFFLDVWAPRPKKHHSYKNETQERNFSHEGGGGLRSCTKWMWGRKKFRKYGGGGCFFAPFLS